VVNTQLQVGDVKETLEIASEPPAVNSTSSTLSNVVSGPVVRDLPINGRDWMLLAAPWSPVSTLLKRNFPSRGAATPGPDARHA